MGVRLKGVPRRVDMPTLSWNLQLHNDGSQRSDGVRSFPLDMFYSKVYAFDFFSKHIFLVFFSPIFFRKKIRFQKKVGNFSKKWGNFAIEIFSDKFFSAKKKSENFFLEKNQKYKVYSKTYPKESF